MVPFTPVVSFSGDEGRALLVGNEIFLAGFVRCEKVLPIRSVYSPPSYWLFLRRLALECDPAILVLLVEGKSRPRSFRALCRLALIIIHLSRFQRYQLPAWAHTKESHALEPEPASSSAEPLEPRRIEGDVATAPCNTGTPVDKLVAVAAHTSEVAEKSKEMVGNPSPLSTGNDDVDEVADAGCRETSGEAFDVDDIPQFEALRPSHRVRRQSERGQNVPAAPTERSSRRTSKIGKGDKLGDSGAIIRNKVVGWQSERAEVRGGRVPTGALGAREESSGAGAGKATQGGLGVQGPGEKRAKSVGEEVSRFGPSSAGR